jgi:radical SAM protein with 4Fe4S-binding SPASM domain
MKDRYSARVTWDKLGPWARADLARRLYTIEFELTARCNNECRHCYINLPAGDRKAKAKELSFDEIADIAGQALSLGAVWCLLTGGEPLLREDFADIYLHLKKRGLLVSVFTNAALISDEHVRLFKKYPPKNMEVSVYGVTRETYEKVTRKPGSFEAFSRGLGLLLENGIPVRLKAMALRSNAHELDAIAEFCRARTKDYFRFDPFLHMRYDRDRKRNAEIASERLSPEEIVALERSDPERFQALKERGCDLILPEEHEPGCDHLIKCGAGRDSLVIGPDGGARLCYSLCHPDCVYDLRAGTVSDAFFNFVPKIRDLRSRRKEYRTRCNGCALVNLCLWCPAHAHLETGKLDKHVDYFCKVAHAREKMITEAGAR